jgi:hypothetical protein
MHTSTSSVASIRFGSSITQEQFDYVESLPLAITGADTRELTHNPQRLYAFEGEAAMAYIEYDHTDERITVAWIANWGHDFGHVALDEMLLRHALMTWDVVGVKNVRIDVKLRKKDPTWMYANQTNMLHRSGFVSRYWSWDDPDEVVHRMQRKCPDR